MPAPRDIDWTHIHVNGPRGAGVPYISFARKMLGFVKQDAARNNLGVHSLTRKLPDGAVIRAELHGSIPRVVITPPGAGYVREADWLEEGIMVSGTGQADTPDVFISRVEKPNGGFYYKSYFRNKKSEGYARATIEKGFWGRIQPELATAAANPDNRGMREKYAKKLRYAHEVDTITFGAHDTTHINRDGESVSWYTGRCGYFCEPNVIPNYQGSVSVSCRGSEIYSTVTSPSEAPLWTVRAAAIKESFLYVVVAEGKYTVDYPPPPPSPSRQIAYIPPLAAARDVPVKIIKVPLFEVLDEETLHVHYRGDKNAVETLWEGILRNGDSPWVFDEDVTHAVCIARPDEARLIWFWDEVDPANEAIEHRALVTPSESHQRFFFDIENRNMDVSDAGDVIAEDSGNVLRLERVIDHVGHPSWYWVWEGNGVTKRFTARNYHDTPWSFVERQLVFANVRYGRFVFTYENTWLDLATYKTAYTRRYVEVVDKDQTHTYGNQFDVAHSSGGYIWATQSMHRPLKDNLAAPRVSSYAVMMMRGCGPSGHPTHTQLVDGGTRTADFTYTTSPRERYKNKHSGLVVYKDSIPVYYGAHIIPLIYSTYGFEDSRELHYGGVAYNSVIYEFDTRDLWSVKAPNPIPAANQTSGVNYPVSSQALSELAPRSGDLWEPGSKFGCFIATPDCTLVDARIWMASLIAPNTEIRVRHITGGSFTETTGCAPDSHAVTATYWGKPPKSQRKHYRRKQ